MGIYAKWNITCLVVFVQNHLKFFKSSKKKGIKVSSLNKMSFKKTLFEKQISLIFEKA